MSWFFHSSSHQAYHPLPTDEALLPSKNDKKSFDYDSIFTFETKKDKMKYKSVFKFDEDRKNNLEADYYDFVSGSADKTPVVLLMMSWMLTGFSYLMFLVGFPITYWFCVVKLGESDRLVVFRLGKMLGVKGPGRVVTFPWMDKCKRVDVRASAFSVPPQQFITQDGGIVEMGAEVQYAIVDVATMVKEVADHQDILRSLGKSLITKVLTKRSTSQLIKDRRIAAQKILDDLNLQVRKWGIDVRSVNLSDPKVLKQPEDRSALGPVLQNMGLKQEQQFPSPEQFVRNNFGSENSDESDAAALNQLASVVGGFLSKTKAEGGSLDLASMLGGMGQTGGNGVKMASVGEFMSPSMQPIMAPVKEAPVEKKSDWHRALEGIICNDPIQLESDAMGVYELQILESEVGTESFYIDITPASKTVTKITGPRRADVSVSITSSDLAGVLQGTLSPLQAYLTGRISANGDVKKLMFFDKLSSRGHKPGSMFTI
eukprot:TRINITY_DN13146_c0_g1_i1.p1 TRINITY_DN13146_c0_g1~~TRINITY_DN13146_c0_g1_i1.p1  ORF type:complete len:486 (-),score=92.30 TRINITY_DN13146_c0_g1_i1:1119-2576(-)